MNIKQLNILLADDDKDDRLFFKMALDASSIPTKLVSVADGEILMNYLSDNISLLPDVLFLDLNMPRKNGFECLTEIKNNKNLHKLPVIIFSTSFELEVVNQLYQNGAKYFIRKPAEFSQLKIIIEQTVELLTKTHTSQPTREDFVLTITSDQKNHIQQPIIP
jgi:DNA-binding NtrC family response regulator